MAFRANINVDITDAKSLDRAIKLMENYDDLVDDAITNALDELQWRIEKRLREELNSFGLAGSKLASSIVVDRRSQEFEIYVLGKHAMFVEFGTGIEGEDNPHPNVTFNDAFWEYDTNSHGEKGWWYPTDESDTNPTKKYSEKKGIWFAWTKGMPARPFMYRTWRYARNITTKMFNKHLERIFK